MTTNEILTVAEVALELRCSKAHVYNVIAGRVDGVCALPAISMGRRKTGPTSGADTLDGDE